MTGSPRSASLAEAAHSTTAEKQAKAPLAAPAALPSRPSLQPLLSMDMCSSIRVVAVTNNVLYCGTAWMSR